MWQSEVCTLLELSHSCFVGQIILCHITRQVWQVIGVISCLVNDCQGDCMCIHCTLLASTMACWCVQNAVRRLWCLWAAKKCRRHTLQLEWQQVMLCKCSCDLSWHGMTVMACTSVGYLGRHWDAGLVSCCLLWHNASTVGKLASCCWHETCLGLPKCQAQVGNGCTSSPGIAAW